MSNINITPLTDVLLVLLITFLLSASSFQEISLDMPLPRVAEVREVADSMTRVAVGVDGAVQWPVPSLAGQPDAVAFAQLREVAEKPILALAVHRDLTYSQLYPLMLAASQGGWQHLVLLTEAAP
jgi:biopolymer transport protein ExbD